MRLAVLLAVLAHQLDAARREEGAPGRGVDHLDQSIHMYMCVRQITVSRKCSFDCINLDFIIRTKKMQVQLGSGIMSFTWYKNS